MYYKNFLFTISFAFFFLPLKRASFTGVCQKVIDGDTIIVAQSSPFSTKHRAYKVRLAFIDAPELSQKSLWAKRPIGKISRDYLKGLIERKKVMIKLYGKGKYGRFIGEIFLEQKNINLLMLESGNALVYKFENYPSNLHRAYYHSAQYLAKMTRKGVWGSDSFESPKNYRKIKNNKKEAKRPRSKKF